MLSTAWLLAQQTVPATAMIGAVLDPDKTRATPVEERCLLGGTYLPLQTEGVGQVHSGKLS